MRQFLNKNFLSKRNLYAWIMPKDTFAHIQYFLLPRSLKSYKWRDLLGDLNAGLNSALLAFPQGIAYALILGVPLVFGLYSSAIAAILGAFFSKCPYVALGPTNATTVMVMSTFALLERTPDERLIALPILGLMIAIFLMAGSYLRLGNIVQYVSRSVMTGYVTASAALILANQGWKVLGISMEKPAITFYKIVYQTVLHIHEVHFPTIGLAAGTLGLYWLLNRFFQTLPNIALTLVGSSLGGWLMIKLGWDIPLLGPIQVGHWAIHWPPFAPEEYMRLGSSALAISLLCLMESASSVKSLVAKAGQKFDINQEMFSLGAANLGCAVSGGIPCSTSPSRSNLSFRSGAKTGLNNIFCGLFCLLIGVQLGFLTAHIPSVTLSTLILIVGFAMIQPHAIRLVMRSTPGDALVFLTTFLAGLILPLDTAVYAGVIVSIALFLRKASTPQMVEYTFDEMGQLTQRLDKTTRSDIGISIVHLEGNLFFGAADLFHEQIRRVCEDKNLKIVILKMRNAYHLDATSVLALQELINYMQDENRVLLFSEVRRDTLQVFKRSGLLQSIGTNRLFIDNKFNPTLSTARALRRAQEILGNPVTRISIYT